MLAHWARLVRSYWLVAVACFWVWGGAAGPHLFDAGELLAAAWLLGGSHPPGQPLHAIAGHALTWVPLGPLAFRVTWLSILGEISAAWWLRRIVAFALREMRSSDLARVGHQNGEDRAGIGNQSDVGDPSGLTVWAPEAAAAGALLAGPLLRQATRIEVYGLALSLALASFDQLARWSHGGPWWRLHWSMLLCGLLMAVHPPHAFGVLVAAIVIVGGLRPDALRSPRALVLGMGAWVLPTATYLYLPIRALAGASMWGSPRTPKGFLAYVSGAAYRSNLNTMQGIASTLPESALFVAKSCGWIPLIGCLVWMARSRMRSPIAVAVPAMVLVAALQPVEPRNPDNVAYAATAVALCCAAGALGFASLQARRARHSSSAAAALGLALVALHPMALRNAVAITKADLPVLETVTSALTSAPAPRALVVLETDFAAASWMHARATDGARPDVAVLVTGLSTSSWHWRTLRSHPAFDGRPMRERGERGRAAFVGGAVGHALRHVAVASETDWPLRAEGDVVGPYLQLGAPSRLRAADTLARVIETETRQHETDPFDNADAVLRHYHVTRGRRLAVRDQRTHALRAFKSACAWLPRDRLALIHAEGASPNRRLVPPTVRDPDAFLTSKGDAVRETAVWLWVWDERRAAERLLATLAEREDPRALLQLAWLYATSGRSEAAQAALTSFSQAAPERVEESDQLRMFLEGSSTR